LGDAFIACAAIPAEEIFCIHAMDDLSSAFANVLGWLIQQQRGAEEFEVVEHCLYPTGFSFASRSIMERYGLRDGSHAMAIFCRLFHAKPAARRKSLCENRKTSL